MIGIHFKDKLVALVTTFVFRSVNFGLKKKEKDMAPNCRTCVRTLKRVLFTKDASLSVADMDLQGVERCLKLSKNQQKKYNTTDI
jgi:hypothetical protein